MVFHLEGSLNLFEELSSTDSIVILLYLIAAFLLGAISMLFFKKDAGKKETDNKGWEKEKKYMQADYDILLQAMESAKSQALELKERHEGSSIAQAQVMDDEASRDLRASIIQRFREGMKAEYADMQLTEDDLEKMLQTKVNATIGRMDSDLLQLINEAISKDKN